MFQVESTPPPPADFKRNFLSVSKSVSTLAAASALRAYWEKTTLADRIRNGLRFDRYQIDGKISETAKPMLTATFETEKGGKKSLLCVFSDASAIVWRCDVPNSVSERYDEYHALPVVLRLTNIVRQIDKNPTYIRTRKQSPRDLGIFIGEDKTFSAYVNLTAPPTCGAGHTSYETRQILLSALMEEVHAWADLIESTPVPHLPASGSLASGYISEEDLCYARLPANSRIPYAVPAFLPWSGLTDLEGKHLCDFAKDVSSYLYLIQDALVDVEIDSALLTQRGSPKPVFRTVVNRAPGNCIDTHAFQSKCTDFLCRLMGSDLAPVEYGKIIGQDLTWHKNKRPWLSPLQIARCFHNEKYSNLSAHEVIELHRRFDPFWKT